MFIYFEDAEATRGTQLTLSLHMKHSMDVSGFQCNILLPDGFTVSKVLRGEAVKARDKYDEYSIRSTVPHSPTAHASCSATA